MEPTKKGCCDDCLAFDPVAVCMKPSCPCHTTSKDWEELDILQRDIWARVNEVLTERGVKYEVGDAYAAGASIKEILHPRVQSLLTAQKQELAERVRKEIEALIDFENSFNEGNDQFSKGAKASASSLKEKILSLLNTQTP